MKEIQYTTKGIMNYKIITDDNNILYLDKVSEDKMVRAKSECFLILRNATINTKCINILSKNFKKMLKIQRMQKIIDENNNKELICNIEMKNAEIIYMSLENKVKEFETYKIIFKLSNSNNMTFYE